MGRRIVVIILGLVAIVPLLAVATVLLLGPIDLGALAAMQASAILGRSVSITGLHITPGRWLTVDLRGVTVANLAGGGRPAMIMLTRLTTEIDLLSLLSGPVALRRLDVDGLSVRLEHVADGTPNWRWGRSAPPRAVPEDRSRFPDLGTVHIHDSEIIVHTSGGHDLQTRFDDATLRTDGPEAPVQLDVSGAYHDVPVTLAATLQSIATLRQAAIPYGTDILLTSGETTLRFEGTMTQPLDVDGLNGRLTLHAPTMTALLAAGDAKQGFAASLELTGLLTRSDTVWALAGTTGRLNDNVLAPSTARLTDGGRGHPDALDLDLTFERLALDPLLAGRSKAPDSVILDPAPDPQLNARLTARQVWYRGQAATDVTVSAAITPDRIDLRDIALTAFGARFQASGRAEAAGKQSRLSAEAQLSGMDVQQLRQQIGARTLPVTGRLDGQFVADSVGNTWEQATKSAHVAAVVSMRNGSISRDVLEKLSTDIRRLFRAPKGVSPIACLLGVVDWRAGIATLSPLRVRTANGTIAGHGQIDLNRQSLDVTLGSQSATTSNFALDVPFRIQGPFSNPVVRPAVGRPSLVAADLGQLPPSLSRVARQNPCISVR